MRVVSERLKRLGIKPMKEDTKRAVIALLLTPATVQLWWAKMYIVEVESPHRVQR